MQGEGPRCPQVEHDHVYPSFHALPGLQALAHRAALLQQKEEGQDVGEAGVGQGAAFCGEETGVAGDDARRSRRHPEPPAAPSPLPSFRLLMKGLRVFS